MTDALQVTSGVEWRKARESAILKLPSGRVVEARAVSFFYLLKLGRIPDQLTTQVIDHVFGSADLVFDLKKPKNLQAFLELLDAVCESCLVNPRVVKEAKADDEITVDDVIEADKMFLYKLINRPASELATFREEQEGDVANLDNESELLREAE